MHRPVLQLLRQLFFGAMDMELHSANFDPTSSMVRVSPPLLQRNESTLLSRLVALLTCAPCLVVLQTAYDVQHELAKKYTIIPPLPNDRFLNS